MGEFVLPGGHLRHSNCSITSRIPGCLPNIQSLQGSGGFHSNILQKVKRLRIENLIEKMFKVLASATFRAELQVIAN